MAARNSRGEDEYRAPVGRGPCRVAAHLARALERGARGHRVPATRQAGRAPGASLRCVFMEAPELVQRLSDRIRAGGGGPVAQLIVEELWLAVVEGSLAVGQRLPTARQLAIALGVSPRSIERAYAELERRGVTATSGGSGTFVSLTHPSEEDRARHQELARLCRELLERAGDIGFDVDDVLESVAELRSAGSESQPPEPGP